MERRNAENEISDESIFDLFRNRADAEPPGARSTASSGRRRSTSLSFLPLEGADPFSGLLVTGWGSVGGTGAATGSPSSSPTPSLDARALKVAAFRQSGGRAVPVGDAENRALEDAILTRARQLRIAAAPS